MDAWLLTTVLVCLIAGGFLTRSIVVRAALSGVIVYAWVLKSPFFSFERERTWI